MYIHLYTYIVKFHQNLKKYKQFKYWVTFCMTDRFVCLCQDELFHNMSQGIRPKEN